MSTRGEHLQRRTAQKPAWGPKLQSGTCRAPAGPIWYDILIYKQCAWCRCVLYYSNINDCACPVGISVYLSISRVCFRAVRFSSHALLTMSLLSIADHCRRFSVFVFIISVKPERDLEMTGFFEWFSTSRLSSFAVDPVVYWEGFLASCARTFWVRTTCSYYDVIIAKHGEIWLESSTEASRETAQK